MTITRRLAILATGALAGLIAAILMSLIQVAFRTWFGISPPQELIPDRLAPTLDVDRFVELVNQYGYNELKKLGIRGGVAGVLVAGTLIGLAYAWVVESRASRAAGAWHFGTSRRGLLFVALAFVALYGGSLAILAPNLDANFKGLPPSQARLATAGGYLVAYLAYAVALVLGYRLMVRRPIASAVAPADLATDDLSAEFAEPGSAVDLPVGRPLPRRAVVGGAVGAALAFPALRLLDRLYDQATFSYDGRRYNGTGIQPITPTDKFYSVTKNVVDPRVDPDLWRLEITGLVSDSKTYTYKQLTALPSTTQLTTLMCISNHVSAGLMSNAEWRGVPMADLLTASGVDLGRAVEVVLRSADGYTDTFAIDKAMDPTTLVVYEINGGPLPEKHGFPARVVVPGLYGEKNAKWLTGIEVVDHDVKGFYEQQGWGPNFVIPTRSDFFAPAMAAGNTRFRDPFKVGQAMDFRGRAFAGDRGITKVEISFDDAKTWQEVDAFDYESTRLEWVFWRHRWTPRNVGEQVLAVRAFDGSGELQELVRRASHPREGVTGMHRVRATIEA